MIKELEIWLNGTRPTEPFNISKRGGNIMTERKSLGTLMKIFFLISLLVFILGLAGCELAYPEYRFNGRIGEEQINTHEITYGFFPATSNIEIEVRKPNGNRIIYMGTPKKGSQLLSLSIIADGKKSTYYVAGSSSRYSLVVQEMIAEAETRFKEYLKKISEFNASQFYE